jgi:adenylate cyclase class 2
MTDASLATSTAAQNFTLTSSIWSQLRRTHLVPPTGPYHGSLLVKCGIIHNMIEVELKYSLPSPDAIRAMLSKGSPPIPSVYDDTYLDAAGLPGDEPELRIRQVSSGEPPSIVCIVTFKGATVDQDSDSKHEYELICDRRDDALALLSAMGYEPVLRLTKHCEVWQIVTEQYDYSLTLAHLRDDAQHYLEIETLIPDDAAPGPALHSIRQLATELGLSDQMRTSEAYTARHLSISNTDSYEP